MTRTSRRTRASEMLRPKSGLTRGSKMVRWTDVIGLVAFFSAIACGDDDGPAGKCKGLVAGASQRVDECKVLSNVTQFQRDQARAMHCDEVQGEGATYDKCVDDIQARDCQAWINALNQDFALPDSCRTAFTAGGTK